jgi:hypothetical protein
VQIDWVCLDGSESVKLKGKKDRIGEQGRTSRKRFEIHKLQTNI